jgi:LysM repeat protein
LSFKTRTTKPEAGNKYYIRKANGGFNPCIAGSPTDSACNVLANCVGYATGRFNEIIGKGNCDLLGNMNAECFVEIAKKQSLTISQTPEAGACMVWQKGATLAGSDGAGHVAIVEQVISPTKVITSESGYGSNNPFWNATREKGADGNWGASKAQGYVFLGFVLNPAVTSASNTGASGAPSDNVLDSPTAGGTTATPSSPLYDGKYITKSGDTFKILAVSFGSTEIKAGTVFEFAPVVAQSPPKTYTVVKGDTLSAIARKFGVNLATLVGLNGIANANLIYVGQVIKLP